MIGLILVTHGHLAQEFKLALEHVVGDQQSVEAINIGPDDDMEKCRQQIADCIARVDTGRGVIILTDLFGGTPSNLAISLMKEKNIEVIAGINLPMLVKLASIRETAELDEAVLKAQEAGRKYIQVASSLLQDSA